MGERTARLLSHRDDGRLLSWENLGEQPASKAFWQTLGELLLSPAQFFERMATSGGLREPLSFLWVIVTVTVIVGFPLALSYFALTAPSPLDVSAEAYSRYLLAPRLAGFAIVLLPVVLVLVGVLAVLTGGFFHLGARLFGAHGWEGSVSIWCYAHSAAAALLAAAETVACVVSISCYLATLAWTGADQGAATVARTAVWGLGGLGVLGGLVLLVVSLAVGCAHTFGLEAPVATAAALAGFLLATLVTAGPAVCFVLWGQKVGLTALAVAAAFTAVAFLSACASRRSGQRQAAPAGKL